MLFASYRIATAPELELVPADELQVDVLRQSGERRRPKARESVRQLVPAGGVDAC